MKCIALGRGVEADSPHPRPVISALALRSVGCLQEGHHGGSWMDGADGPGDPQSYLTLTSHLPRSVIKRASVLWPFGVTSSVTFHCCVSESQVRRRKRSRRKQGKVLGGLGSPDVLSVRWLTRLAGVGAGAVFGEVGSTGQDLEACPCIGVGAFLGQVPRLSKDWGFVTVTLCGLVYGTHLCGQECA